MLWDGLESAFQWIPPQGQHTPGLPNMVVFTLLAHIHTKDKQWMSRMHVTVTVYWSIEQREYALY